jgi:TolB-like protein
MGNRNPRSGIYLGAAIWFVALSVQVCAGVAWSRPIPGLGPQQAGAVPLSQGVADLASQLARGIPESHPMTVAVTDFPDLGGQTCRLGRYVAERLSTLLSQHPQCRLIERRRLDMVLQELKFSMSELVDPAKARKLGQMLGVQGLVIGTISDVGSTLDLDARIIDIQTDVSLPGASASVVKDEAVRQLSADCGQGTAPPASGAQGTRALPLTPTGAASRIPEAVHKITVEGLTFELESCRISGSTVTCRLAITSGSRQDLDAAVGFSSRWEGRNTRLIDNSGNEYNCQTIRFGTHEDSFRMGFGGPVQTTLVSGISTDLVLMFNEVNQQATKAALLEIGGYIREPSTRRMSNFVARLRDIPLAK